MSPPAVADITPLLQRTWPATKTFPTVSGQCYNTNLPLHPGQLQSMQGNKGLWGKWERTSGVIDHL